MFTNARSINKKINELKTMACDLEPEVIAVTETWTNQAITNDYLEIPNYVQIARSDRQDTKEGRGGGILVYAKSSINAFQKPNNSRLQPVM